MRFYRASRKFPQGHSRRYFWKSAAMGWALAHLIFMSMAIYNLSTSLDTSASSDTKHSLELEYGASSDPFRMQIQTLDRGTLVNALPIRTREGNLLRGIKLLDQVYDENLNVEMENSEDIHNSDEFLDGSSPTSSAIRTILRQLVEEHRKVHRNFFMVAKKNIHTLFPYICSPPYHWKRLDPDHYPTHVQTVHCTTSDCPHFRHCRPKEYQVRVLRKMGHNEGILDTEVAALPAALQTEIPIPERYVTENEPNTVRFKFTEITVNVTCECSRTPM